MDFDVILVGAGPGGIYCAYELSRLAPQLNIAVFEAGHPLPGAAAPAGEPCGGCRPAGRRYAAAGGKPRPGGPPPRHGPGQRYRAGG